MPVEIEIVETVPVPQEPNAIILQEKLASMPLTLLVYEDIDGKRGRELKRLLIWGKSRIWLPPGKYHLALQARCEEDRFDKNPNVKEISLYEEGVLVKFKLKSPTASERKNLQPHPVEPAPEEEPPYRRMS
ncbi:MAG: hypothetical protein ACXQS7_05615 [Candidatus Syntropharchaeia archaeon]